MSKSNNIKFKDDIIVEYDHIKLLSLDDYLDDEISRGPKEKAGSINYHYQHYDNVYNYFMIELLEANKFKTLCVPQFYVQWGDYVTRTAVAYNIETNELLYSPLMNNAIYKCYKKKKTRFIYFTFIIIPTKKAQLTHANIVIIDLDRETVERFEPYGHGWHTSVIDSVFTDKIMKRIGFEKFKYISPKKLSPLLGIQSKADAYNGMCVTITMLYLHLRILHPDKTPQSIIKTLLKKSKDELTNIILRYAKHVEKTLKRNKNIVFHLYDKLDTMKSY